MRRDSGGVELMDKYIKPELNTIYFDAEGKQYICVRNEFGYSILKRVSDGWVFKAHGLRMDENGAIYWSYSTGGGW